MKNKQRFVVEDTSQTIPFIKDTETNESYDLISAIGKILDNQKELLTLAKE